MSYNKNIIFAIKQNFLTLQRERGVNCTSYQVDVNLPRGQIDIKIIKENLST